MVSYNSKLSLQKNNNTYLGLTIDEKIDKEKIKRLSNVKKRGIELEKALKNNKDIINNIREGNIVRVSTEIKGERKNLFYKIFKLVSKVYESEKHTNINRNPFMSSSELSVKQETIWKRDLFVFLKPFRERMSNLRIIISNYKGEFDDVISKEKDCMELSIMQKGYSSDSDIENYIDRFKRKKDKYIDNKRLDNERKKKINSIKIPPDTVLAEVFNISPEKILPYII